MSKRLPKNLRWEEVANALKKLGYEPTDKRSGTHVLFVNSEHKMVTVFMKNPVKRGTLEMILEKVGMSIEEFLDLL